jgi:hypothetical protein
MQPQRSVLRLAFEQDEPHANPSQSQGPQSPPIPRSPQIVRSGYVEGMIAKLLLAAGLSLAAFAAQAAPPPYVD